MNYEKHIYIVIILFSVFCNNIYGQTVQLQEEIIVEEEEFLISHCQFHSPEFPGGIDSLSHFIKKHYNIPNYQETTKVLIRFAINEEGRAIDIEIENILSWESEYLLMNILRQMPQWTPCKNRSLYCVVIPLIIVSEPYSLPSIYIKGKKFKGYVFKAHHWVFGNPRQVTNRYLPTYDDILEVENILNKSWGYINQNKYNPPINKRTLRKYKRQYVGYQTEDNQKIIWINFLKGYKDKERLSKDVISIYDGGSYFWHVYVNITTGEIFEMQVNGIAQN